MALNSRQISYVQKLKNFSSAIQVLYGQAFELKESHAEEFDDGQENSLLAETTDLEAVYQFDSADVKTAVNQAVDNFINYWTGSAVTTREYGKDIRRIK